MITLTNLPNEIHQQIISSLESHQDVAALSIQCHSLHALCDLPTRKKYRQIRIVPVDWSLDIAFARLMEILKQPRLGRYVRCIENWEKPMESEHYVLGEDQRKLPEEEMQLLRAATQEAGFVDSEGEAVVNMLLQKLVDEERERCDGRSDIMACHLRGTFITQALTSLLISVSPNLESLAMAPPFNYYDDRFYSDEEVDEMYEQDEGNEEDEQGEGDEQDEGDEQGQLDRKEIHSHFPLDNLLLRTNRDPSNKPYLQNLRRVYFINCPPSYASRLYDEMDFYSCLELIDHLPSIEKVNTDLLTYSKESKYSLDPDSSNISSIAINHSCVGEWYLEDVIKSCKTLREFRYSIGGRALSLWRGGVAFNPKALVENLLRHRKTLEVLDLDMQSDIRVLSPRWELRTERYIQNFDVFSEGPEWWEEKHNGWLKSFLALKRLSLGVKLLMYYARGAIKEYADKNVSLVDCLPESLEYLCIRGYGRGQNPDVDAQMDRLMAVKETGVLKLKVIEGVEKYIPNAEHVRDASNINNMWKLEENWTGRW